MTDSKLIMKNTGFMAVRMLLSMAVSLYTSRVVLLQLGVTDFGIFTVIGGLAIIMSFFTSALSAAIQRYMSVELAVSKGKGMQGVFSACWVCVLVMAGIFVLFAEVVGLWFLDTVVNIPPDRMDVAGIVFQLSLVIVVIEMLRVPYNAMILAYEYMDFFAYNSILEVALKLITAIMLSLTAGNKIIIYMFLLIGVAALINLAYVVYCRRKISGVRFSLRANHRQAVSIGKFAGWNVITSISDIAYQQGSGLILNIFFGVGFNSSMGIANQVKSAVVSFTRSVQSAANPQIIKIFSAGEQNDFEMLFMRISRISFYLTMFLGIPVLLNARYVLSLWLTVIPPAGVEFVQLMIIFCVIDSLVGPLWVTMQATGKIASYQIVVSTIWLLCLPLTYIIYKLGMPSYSLFWVMIFIDASLIIVRLWFTSRFCRIRISAYLRGVALPVLAVSVAGIIVPALCVFLIENPLVCLLVSGAIWCLTFPASIWALGLTDAEHNAIKDFVKKKFKL